MPDLRADAERQRQLLVVLPPGSRRHDDPGARECLVRVGELARVVDAVPGPGSERRGTRAAARIKLPAALLPGDKGGAKRAKPAAARSTARDDRAVQSLLDYLLG